MSLDEADKLVREANEAVASMFNSEKVAALENKIRGLERLVKDLQNQVEMHKSIASSIQKGLIRAQDEARVAKHLNKQKIKIDSKTIHLFNFMIDRLKYYEPVTAEKIELQMDPTILPIGEANKIGTSSSGI